MWAWSNPPKQVWSIGTASEEGRWNASDVCGLPGIESSRDQEQVSYTFGSIIVRSIEQG